MDLLPTEEQQQIVDATIDFLKNELPVSRVHKVRGDIPLISRDQWKQIAELGWFGIGLAEEHGGVGYSLAEETLIFREFGRYLTSPSILGAVLGARVAAGSGNDELITAIVGGEKMVGVSNAVSQDAKIGETVSGEFQLIEADGVDLVLFVGEESAALVDRSAISGAEKVPCLDEKVSLSIAKLDGVSAVACVARGQDDIFQRGVVLSAAMLVGIAEAARDLSIEYAKVREQFGKPIGSFQAIKHRCADMAVRCEAASSLTLHACLAVRDGLPEGRFEASAAKALAAEAAKLNAAGSVQVHGGMGFTDQMDPHLYVKRGHVLDQMFGSTRYHLADLLGQPAPQ